MTPQPTIRLLVGLGNPGPGYAMNRHNIGFHVIDTISSHLNLGRWQDKFNGLYTGTKLGLLKPKTYMNNSGEAVLSCCSYHRIQPEQVLVIHDDLDLPLGVMRLKQGGGHAGHNGVRSIQERIGGEFHRLRLGIGRPHPPIDAAGHVLGNFSADELVYVRQYIEYITDHLQQLVTLQHPSGQIKSYS